MIRFIKDFVRTRPPLFDRIRRLRRFIMPKGSDPAYDFLDSFSRSHRDRVCFIQIGANDGLRNDPIREFIVRDRWRGVLIEPLPTVFDLLRQNYAHTNNSDLVFVNAAVSAQDGALQPFYSFADAYLATLSLEQRLDHLRKASFQRDHVLRMVGPNNAAAIRETTIPCLSMRSVLAKHWPQNRTDILVIDAEGHEPDILRAIDFGEFRPAVIFFESHNLGEEKDSLFALLTTAGYGLTPLGPDTAAVLTIDP